MEYIALNPLLSLPPPGGAYLLQTHSKWGRGVFLEKTMVSVLHIARFSDVRGRSRIERDRERTRTSENQAILREGGKRKGPRKRPRTSENQAILHKEL